MIYHYKNLIDKLLIDNQRANKLLYNCRNKEDCPTRGICNSEKVASQSGSRGSAIIDTPFPTLYSETKYRCGFGVWKIDASLHKWKLQQLMSLFPGRKN